MVESAYSTLREVDTVSHFIAIKLLIRILFV